MRYQLNPAQLTEFKEQAFMQRARDAANYIGPIDIAAIIAAYAESFERFAFKNGQKVDFEEYIAQGENLITIVMTAHPTFFKSQQEAGLLSRLFTAYATGDKEEAENLESQIRTTQADHPYKDPQTDQEGEQLYNALHNTVDAGHMMQTAMMRVAQKHYPDQWRQGRYSPFNRAIWQKFDRDGRDIPINVQLSETIRQRRLGLELVYLPQFEALKHLPEVSDPEGVIANAIKRMNDTIDIYKEKEAELAALDDENIDMTALQAIIDDLHRSKDERITHPGALVESLHHLTDNPDTPVALFEHAKIIVDDLKSNGLCFATPTHRVNAKAVYSYLDVERHKLGKGALQRADTISADKSHFGETEAMIANAKDRTVGSFTEILARVPQDGKAIHEMMLIRRLVNEAIDSHTIEKIDIAEGHNAMTQRALRLASKQYGVSEITDIGLLHEDSEGIDHARKIYTKLLKSDAYLAETAHTVPGTNKKRPRLVLKIGYSDFAKQHSSPGGKPSNEKCLLQIMRAIEEAGLAEKIDLDIEFAGGEGPGRRTNPKGYEWTLKEIITPAVLTYASKCGIRLKYRETIQGGDGCILLGTEQSAAKVMALQLNHLTANLTKSTEQIWNSRYYGALRDDVSEHHEAAREAYHELYNDHDFALLMKLHKELCEKGGSRKIIRSEQKGSNDKDEKDKSPLADLRAIGFNAASIETGVHLPPVFGQGTAFYQNMERTQRLVKSRLFRERLMTAFMVRDLHMTQELEDFAELYNPAYWQKFEKFDDQGRETTQSRIARRLDELRYTDDSIKRVYPRLKRAIRLIRDDLEKFDQIRKRDDFLDVETLINEGDYKERLGQKRRLLAAIHKSRLDTTRDIFFDLESTPVYSPDYTREQRSYAIKAGMRLASADASKVFDPANGKVTGFSSRFKHVKSHAAPILDLCYNA